MPRFVLVYTTSIPIVGTFTGPTVTYPTFEAAEKVAIEHLGKGNRDMFIAEIRATVKRSDPPIVVEKELP